MKKLFSPQKFPDPSHLLRNLKYWLAAGFLILLSLLVLRPSLVTAENHYQTPGPDLSIDKSHTGNFQIGDTEAYTIGVTNVGDAAVTGVITVSDTLPTGLTYVVSGSGGVGWTCNAVLQVVTCTHANAAGLNPNQDYSLQIRVTVGQAAAPQVTNSASVSNASDVNSNNNSDADVTIIDSADLAVTKSVSTLFADVGAPITYTIALSNLGPSTATGVELIDALPGEVTFANYTASRGSYNFNSGIWSGIGSMAVSESITLTIRATVDSSPYGTEVTNETDGISSGLYDYNLTNNEDSATFEVAADDLLRVTKSDNNKSTVVANEIYTYTITVENVGDVNISDYVITDTLSAYLEIITDTMGVTHVKSGDNYYWDITQDLGAGTGRDFFVRVRVDNVLPGANTSIINTVAVGSDIPEINKTNNSSTDTNTGSGTRNVTISNTVSPISVQTGQNATYTIRVSNSGSASVTDVVVTDTFSPYVDIISADTNRGSRTINTSTRVVRADFGTLAADQTATLTVVVRVNTVAAANTTVSNTATMTYRFGSTTFSGSASASFSLIRSPILPGTGGVELPKSAETPLSRVYLIAILSALVLAMLGAAILVFGLRARASQPEWAGWAVRMGFMFSITASLFGLAAWGVSRATGNDPVPTLLAQIKSVGKTQATPFPVEDPPWVGQNPEGDLQVLPDFPIPEPTDVVPDENGDLPDTSPVNRIVLPSLGIDTVVKYVPYDGLTWLIAGLQQEVAWMGDTSWPGLGGNTGLAGHVSLRNGRDGPFRYLSQLVPSDEITIYTEENIYTYNVREQRTVTEADFSVVRPTSAPQLTLITCVNWDAGTGFYRDRLVVFADLIGVTPLEEISLGN